MAAFYVSNDELDKFINTDTENQAKDSVDYTSRTTTTVVVSSPTSGKSENVEETKAAVVTLTVQEATEPNEAAAASEREGGSILQRFVRWTAETSGVKAVVVQYGVRLCLIILLIVIVGGSAAEVRSVLLKELELPAKEHAVQVWCTTTRPN